MADRPVTTPRKKTPGRKRRAAGWTLITFGSLVIGAFAISFKWTFGYHADEWSIFFASGRTQLTYGLWGDLPLGWFFQGVFDSSRLIWYFPPETTWQSSQGHLNLRFLIYNKIEGASMVEVVLWPFALAPFLSGGWLAWSSHRARRRAMTGVCLKCGYDLRGLAAGSLCPECGGGAKMVH